MSAPSNYLVWYAGTSQKRTIATLQGVPKESPEWYEGKEFSQRAEIQTVYLTVTLLERWWDYSVCIYTDLWDIANSLAR